jgi:hypothetical protein
VRSGPPSLAPCLFALVVCWAGIVFVGFTVLSGHWFGIASIASSFLLLVSPLIFIPVTYALWRSARELRVARRACMHVSLTMQSSRPPGLFLSARGVSDEPSNRADADMRLGQVSWCCGHTSFCSSQEEGLGNRLTTRPTPSFLSALWVVFHACRRSEVAFEQIHFAG